MVLPGIQALFGFQLIAVFNSRFADDLAVLNKYCTWWLSLWLRLMASRLLLWSMFPLMTGICLGFISLRV